MELREERLGDVQVIRVCADRLDANVAVQFKDGFRGIVSGDAARVVLDLGQVDFLDSSGLGAVVAAMKLVAPDRRLELAGLTPIVERVFLLTRMDTVFPIHRDVAAAVGAGADAS